MRPGRNLRGPGRNVKRNLDPANLPPPKVKPVENAPVVENEVITSTTEISAPNGETPRKPNGNRNSRRGPNRRRSRNSNYRKADAGENSSSSDESSTETPIERRVASVPSYGSDFGEREQQSERRESQQDAPPIQVDNDNQS